MHGLKCEQKVEDCSHLNFTDDVTKAMLTQFSPIQQREILLRIQNQIKSDYEQKIEYSTQALESIERAFKEFLG